MCRYNNKIVEIEDNSVIAVAVPQSLIFLSLQDLPPNSFKKKGLLVVKYIFFFRVNISANRWLRNTTKQSSAGVAAYPLIFLAHFRRICYSHVVDVMLRIL
jgi:hypothetical protein